MKALWNNLRAELKDAPWSIKLALFLLTFEWIGYLRIGLSLLAGSLELKATPELVHAGLFALALYIALLALDAFVIVAICRRQKFGRAFVLVAFCLLTLMRLLFDRKQGFRATDYYVEFGAATALLFISKSTAWFNAQKTYEVE